MSSIAAEHSYSHKAPHTADSDVDLYSDQDISDVITDLRNAGLHIWSENPRLYLVFRDIDHIRESGKPQLLDDFIEKGINDIWLPITSTYLLQQILPPGLHDIFLIAQRRVCSQSTNIQKQSRNAHRNFATKNEAPFEQRRSIGDGSLGHVDEVRSLQDGRLYARKIIRKSSDFKTARKEIQRFHCELETLRRISHRHCVQIASSYTTPSYLAITMLPIADSNLAEYLELADTSLESQHLIRIRAWFGCLATAVHYLHDNQIRHRDIKPANILVHGLNILLVDFELALDWKDLDQSTTTAPCGRTPLYAPPEVINLRKCNSTSDIWSLGCVFLEMVTVLKGKRVDELRRHFISRTDSKCFFNNLRGIHSWISVLAQISDADNDPLLWTSKMLQPERTLRLKAVAVVDLIRRSNCTTSHSNRYFGACCQIPLCSQCGIELSKASSDSGPTHFGCTPECQSRIYMNPSSSEILSVQPLLAYFYPNFMVQHLTRTSMNELMRSLVANDRWEPQESSVEFLCLPNRPLTITVSRFLPSYHLYSSHTEGLQGHSSKVTFRYSLPLGIREPDMDSLAKTFEKYLDIIVDNHLGAFSLLFMKRRESDISSMTFAALCKWFQTWKDQLSSQALHLMKSSIKIIIIQTILGFSLTLQHVPERFKHNYFDGYSGPQGCTPENPSPRLLNRQVKVSFFSLYKLHLGNVVQCFNEEDFLSRNESWTNCLFSSICLAILLEGAEAASHEFLLYARTVDKYAGGSRSGIEKCYRGLGEAVFDRIYKTLSVGVELMGSRGTLMATDLLVALQEFRPRPQDCNASPMVSTLLDFVFRN